MARYDEHVVHDYPTDNEIVQAAGILTRAMVDQVTAHETWEILYNARCRVRQSNVAAYGGHNVHTFDDY